MVDPVPHRQQAPGLVIRMDAVARVVTLFTAIVVGAHVATQVARFAFGRPTLIGITQRLYLGTEANFGAWFSTTLLLLCGLVLWAISVLARQTRAPHARYWALLAAVFVFLSLDEAAAFHELLSPVMAAATANLGVLSVFRGSAGRYGWVLVGIMFAAGVAVSSIRFLRDLPTRTAVLFMAAGAAYVGGALVVESVGGWYSGAYDSDNVTFVTILTVEEVLEMAGAGAFLYSLLAYIGEQYGPLVVSILPWGTHRGY
jgi:hypothetical protein